jgi:NarL family two-component system response regulator LiaR
MNTIKKEVSVSEPTTVIIVDDHEVVRKGIRAYLDTVQEFKVVGEAASGEEALGLVTEFIPDTQVVVLTSYHEDVHIFPALKAGAISYILKDMRMDKLIDALRRAAHGEVTLHPKVATRVLQNMREGEGEDPQLFTDLTDRELEVLRLIANGLSNNQIAAKLVISENTVKGHVSNILSKLHFSDRTQVAVYAWQRGIVQRD